MLEELQYVSSISELKPCLIQYKSSTFFQLDRHL